MEKGANGWLKPASELLKVLDQRAGALPFVDVATLADGLAVTEPARHVRADDEFAVLLSEHVEALVALDEHPALRILEEAKAAKSLDLLLSGAFVSRAREELPGDGEGAMDAPEPEECDECLRPTFLPSGWDPFGGTNTEGVMYRLRVRTLERPCLGHGRRRGDPISGGPGPRLRAVLGLNGLPPGGAE